MSGMFAPAGGHQALVAAFMSALVRQELIALLILTMLTALWMVIRELRPDLALPRRSSLMARRRPEAGSTVAGPARDEAPARRLLRLGFGALWLLDGVLQIQPAMPSGLASGVMVPAAATSPPWVR